MKLQLDEVRRLTGPNLLWNKPGAIVDVLIDGAARLKIVESWQQIVTGVLDEFGWSNETSTYRLYNGGASLAISAPMDALYTACDLAELTWDICVAQHTASPIPDVDARLTQLKADLTMEQNPLLLDFIEQSAVHRVTCLVDDDQVSLGMGQSSEIWAIDKIPVLDTLNWRRYSDVPTAYVTGTNGKSTSVRLAAEIAKAADLSAGVTSTDFIRVGDNIIDHGDYSGPGGARIALRNSKTEIAFLEVARGGMLRRGLPINRVDAALITNVASDHLGQYGINTVEELAEVKFMVSKALSDSDVLVVNADNALVVDQANKSSKTLCWFSTQELNPIVQTHLQRGGAAVFLKEGMLVYQDSIVREEIALVNDVPMTFDGAAQHNIQNALGVIGLCMALGLPKQAIQTGLQTFGSDASDNPGRGNRYEYQGAQVIVDFAHNEHSMSAVVGMVKQLPAKRRLLMFSHAGDRSDKDIIDLTQAVNDLNADVYIVAELPAYLRGRDLGEIPSLVEQTLLSNGVAKEKIVHAASPLDGSNLALQDAGKGDVILLFALDQRDAIQDLLQ